VIQIAGYGRASTDKQQLTPEQQRTIIRNWFDRQCEGSAFEGQEPSFLGTFIDGIATNAYLLDRPVGQMLIPTLDRGDIIAVANRCAEYFETQRGELEAIL
jgi:DNA invertase Pin-like site-specific DNA recombinase